MKESCATSREIKEAESEREELELHFYVVKVHIIIPLLALS